MLNIWFDARNIDNYDLILPKVYNLNYSGIILTPELLDTVNVRNSINIIIDVSENSNYENKNNYILLSTNETSF